MLLDHQDAIAPEHNDPIHELLDDLGEVPTIESLIGGLACSAKVICDIALNDLQCSKGTVRNHHRSFGRMCSKRSSRFVAVYFLCN